MSIEKPFYPQRVTVWCVFWAGRIIGPYFFESEAGAAVLVNGLPYRITINEFLWPELEDMNVDDVYFQQDGATCLTSGETIRLLREKFPGRVISRNGYYNWPPRSYDLTTLGRDELRQCAALGSCKIAAFPPPASTYLVL